MRQEENIRKYTIDTNENRQFLSEIRDNLFEFGDELFSSTGSFYYLGGDGKPWKKHDRETWITCRMVHVYCLAFLLGYDRSLEAIDAGIKGLRGELYDRNNGGWYTGVTAEGEFLPNKLCYVHAFVLLAASSAVLVGIPGANDLLREAIDIYDFWFWNEKEGLSYDTWDTEFNNLDDYRGINANMHTVEAFLAISDVTGDNKYCQRAGRIINHVIEWAKNNQWRIPEHFTKEWVADLEYNREKPDDQFKPFGAIPGHGMEWARLIVQWALSFYKNNEEKISYYVKVSENLYDRSMKDAWNVDGALGMIYTTDWNGKPIVRDRMHWTLAEAINSSAVLFHITKKEKYAKDYKGFLKYLDDCVLDHIHGSWYHQLDCHNNLAETIWPGKPDLYHAVQSTLIPIYWPGQSIASAVKQNNKIDLKIK